MSNEDGARTGQPPVGTRNVIEVAAGLVFRDGRLLIAQRRLEDHLGGLWEFPGGKRDPEESFEECLTRELLEELGIAVEIVRLLETVTHDYPEKSVHLRFFRCRWLAHEPQPLGCRDFAWVRREELAGYTFPAADAGVVQKLQATTAWWQ